MVSLWLDAPVRARVLAMARRQGRSPSDVYRDAIRAGLDVMRPESDAPESTQTD